MRLRLRFLALVGVAGALFVTTLMLGSFRLSVAEVLGSVLHLRDDPSVDFIVQELRLPLALSGLLVGMAFGMAGTLFQRVLRNPLASPDFVGISAGASLFAVTSLALWSVPALGVPPVALIGALTAALLIYLLAWRDGITGYRFILIGIGVSELMFALTGYIIARADIYDARAAMTWLVGSIGQAGTSELVVLGATVGPAVVAAVVLERALRILELGDDAASALGLRVERGRLVLLGIAVVLVAVATAAAGPLAFVALIAGPISMRLLGGSGAGIVAAGLVGAVVVLAADLVCRHALPVALPTGVLTGAIGAPYLIWILATVNREGRGG